MCAVVCTCAHVPFCSACICTNTLTHTHTHTHTHAQAHTRAPGTSFQVLVRGGKIKIIVAEGDAAAAGGVARRRRRRGGGGLGEGCPLPQENFC